MKTAQTDASEDALRAAQIAAAGEVAAEADAARQKLALYADEAREHEITIAQKLACRARRSPRNSPPQVAALQQKAALGDQSLAQKERIDEQILAVERRTQDQMVTLTRKAVDEQAQQYQAFAGTVTQAFNSQLHGLLSGTESWRPHSRTCSRIC